MDMNDIMMQAQRMQAELARAQEDVQKLSYTATSGGGVVEAVAVGDGTIESLKIAPEVVDADDVEMLQDLVVAAVNEALRGVAREGENRMNAVTGGLDLSGLAGMAGLQL